MVSQSSTYSSDVASQCVDGDPDTVCHTQGDSGEADPWWQLELPNGGGAPIGIVSFVALADSCASKMLYGTGCQGEFPTGTYDAADQGVTIGVSDTPCSGDVCGGTVCGRITRSLLSSHTYTMYCHGARGSYVYIQLPGANRVLAMREVEVRTATGPVD